jgi:hypothetical protein
VIEHSGGILHVRFSVVSCPIMCAILRTVDVGFQIIQPAKGSSIHCQEQQHRRRRQQELHRIPTDDKCITVLTLKLSASLLGTF